MAGSSSTDDLYLDAAREAILAVGWSRTTLTDIARRAGVSRMTIYRLVNGKQMFSMKIGGSIRIPESAVDRYLLGEG